MLAEFLCISVLRVASGPRVKLSSCKSALHPPVVYSTDRSKAVVPVLVLLFVAVWFILQSDLFYVLPCVTLVLCFSVLLALRFPRLGKRQIILVLFVLNFSLTFLFCSFLLCGLFYEAICFKSCLVLLCSWFFPFSIANTSLGKECAFFGFVCFLFLFVSGMGCSLWLLHSSLTVFFIIITSYTAATAWKRHAIFYWAPPIRLLSKKTSCNLIMSTSRSVATACKRHAIL